jgi:lipopolysaccharide export system protein LptA
MTSWQKRLRLGLAIFAVAFAGFVYRSIGERPVAAPPRPIDRMDRSALSETTNAVLEQERGKEREFEIRSERTLSYQDRSQKLFNAEITVRRSEGRVFVVTAKEATAGPNQVELQLSGGVKVSVNDGFELVTDHGTFNQNEAVARVPGEMTFKKGHMAGSGLAATYNQKEDVLSITERARVTVTEPDGRISFDGSAGTATLNRAEDLLFLDSKVRVLRGAQIIDADNVMARLSANEDVVTYLELRGNASVQGGNGALDALKANAIDLHYSEDGTILTQVVLTGAASLTTAADEHASSRRMSGERLEVQMAADGSVGHITGQEGVQLELPPAQGAPARTIRAGTLDATGEPGRGLTAARFRTDVVFQENAKPGATSREVHAQALNASLEGDGLRNAFFSGAVVFKEQDLEAGAAEARYQPGKEILNLSGRSRQRPYVTDQQIHIEAREIDVTLESRDMAARGSVSTTLRSPGNAKDRDQGRLPGLLKDGQPASVSAEQLDYGGTNGRAAYEGSATLVQGDTAIRGDRIVIDRKMGDLVVSGSARSSLTLDQGSTEGRADEMRYEEARRTVTYSPAPVAPTSGQGARVPLAQVSGPDGDLRGERIEIVLAGDNAVERLEAYDRVSIVIGGRTASGGRLTYHASDERYVMSGSSTTPVSIRESCRETIGRTLTFFKSTDRVVVDGNETRRTETKPCTPQPLPNAPPPPSPVTR